MPKIINVYQNKDNRYRKFTERELWNAVERHNLIIPVFELIHYGRRCKWRRKDGRAFFSVDGFAKAYNEVYKRRLKHQKEKKNTLRLPEDWQSDGVLVNGVKCYPVKRT